MFPIGIKIIVHFAIIFSNSVDNNFTISTIVFSVQWSEKKRGKKCNISFAQNNEIDLIFLNSIFGRIIELNPNK